MGIVRMFGWVVLVACEPPPTEMTPPTDPCPVDTGPVVDTGPTTTAPATGAELRMQLLCRLAPATELRVRERLVKEAVDEIRDLANYPEEQLKRLGSIDAELVRMDEAAQSLEAALERTGQRIAIAGERIDLGEATAAIVELRAGIRAFRDELAAQLADELVQVDALEKEEQQVEQLGSSVQKKTDDTAGAIIGKIG